MSVALGFEKITKRFGAVAALSDVSFGVEAGTVHALLGENGAGKSTLMKLLAGLHAPDEGVLRIGAESFSLKRKLTPARAIELGIGMVHQHFMLVDNLNVAENIVLGREPMRGPRLDMRRAEDEVAELSAKHGLVVSPRARIDSLSVGQRQRVEILKVLYRGAKLLILDEPTAVLAPSETDAFLKIVSNLAQAGATVLLVTHKLDEIMKVATRASVLRGGRHIADIAIADTSAKELARAMVGRDVAVGTAAARTQPVDLSAGAALSLRDVSLTQDGRLRLDAVSLAVQPGEILGIAGVEGNGQTELAAIIAGLLKPTRGTVHLAQQDVTALSTVQRFSRGLGHIAEDRHAAGLVLGFTLTENLSLGFLHRFAPRGVLRERSMRQSAAKRVAEYDIRPPNPDALASSLSGGNQQKVVVARELGKTDERDSSAKNPRVLVAAQPTRGVDVGAIEAIWQRIASARDGGAAVVLISSELTELLALSDRIAVMVRGKIVTTLDRKDATTELLGEWMLGAASPQLQSREQAL